MVKMTTTFLLAGSKITIHTFSVSRVYIYIHTYTLYHVLPCTIYLVLFLYVNKTEKSILHSLLLFVSRAEINHHHWCLLVGVRNIYIIVPITFLLAGHYYCPQDSGMYYSAYVVFVMRAFKLCAQCTCSLIYACNPLYKYNKTLISSSPLNTANSSKQS